jgi:hypothetical protein
MQPRRNGEGEVVIDFNAFFMTSQQPLPRSRRKFVGNIQVVIPDAKMIFLSFRYHSFAARYSAADPNTVNNVAAKHDPGFMMTPAKRDI